MAKLSWVGIVLAFGACEAASESGSGGGSDIVATPDAAKSDTTAVDDVAAADTDLPDVPLLDVAGDPDATPACPADIGAADGTPCTVEGQSCGQCTDPCQFCNLLRCEGGKWTHLEAFPDPNCGDTSGADVEDPCATVGCAMPPMCDEGCQAECGCCACAEGESTCVTDGTTQAVRTCSSNGCYVESACGPNDLCVAADGVGVGCIQGFGSCVDLEAVYASFTDEAHRACNTNDDCQVLTGHCGVGLGGCYEIVNRATTHELLSGLAKRFGDLGCTAAVCDCMPSPTSAVCQDKVCVAGP